MLPLDIIILQFFPSLIIYGLKALYLTNLRTPAHYSHKDFNLNHWCLIHAYTPRKESDMNTNKLHRDLHLLKYMIFVVNKLH